MEVVTQRPPSDTVTPNLSMNLLITIHKDIGPRKEEEGASKFVEPTLEQAKAYLLKEVIKMQ